MIMRILLPNRQVQALTLIEVLAVIAVIAILAGLLLPALSQAGAKARQTACLSNLKEVGLGFHLFANDHNGKLPMQLSTNQSGSLEHNREPLLLSNVLSFSFHHFLVMSNELGTPKILVCPSDKRSMAESFAALANANVSYWAGVNARQGDANSLLAGDRNIAHVPAKARKVDQPDPDAAFVWTKELHNRKGNVLFADGHVEKLANVELGQALALAFTVQPPEPPPAEPAPAPATVSTSATSTQPLATVLARKPEPATRIASNTAVAIEPMPVQPGFSVRAPAPAVAPSKPAKIPAPSPQIKAREATPLVTTTPPSEPWNTHGFKRLVIVATAGYLLALLLALIMLLLAYLRTRRGRVQPKGN